jgi:hypothetical protein
VKNTRRVQAGACLGMAPHHLSTRYLVNLLFDQLLECRRESCIREKGRPIPGSVWEDTCVSG